MSPAAGLSLQRPSNAVIAAFIARQRDLPLTHPGVGLTRSADAPPGYWRSHRRVALGRGVAMFANAANALRRWEMFNVGWVELVTPDVAPEPGTVVGLLARCLRVWWLNAARIVYKIDEPERQGFAYGTLPGHAQRGEERFLVEIDGDGSVWYDLFAFSQPAHWLARWGRPVARYFQKRFATDSLAAMRRTCGPSLSG